MRNRFLRLTTLAAVTLAVALSMSACGVDSEKVVGGANTPSPTSSPPADYQGERIVTVAPMGSEESTITADKVEVAHSTLSGEDALLPVWKQVDVNTIHLRMWGSSNCPPVLSASYIAFENFMSIQDSNTLYGQCTRDMAPHDFLITSPSPIVTTELVVQNQTQVLNAVKINS
jgi:hypothetical protein